MKYHRHIKLRRNDPCPCNSGKKWKKCCIFNDLDWKKPRKRIPGHARKTGKWVIEDARRQNASIARVTR